MTGLISQAYAAAQFSYADTLVGAVATYPGTFPAATNAVVLSYTVGAGRLALIESVSFLRQASVNPNDYRLFASVTRGTSPTSRIFVDYSPAGEGGFKGFNLYPRILLNAGDKLELNVWNATAALMYVEAHMNAREIIL